MGAETSAIKPPSAIVIHTYESSRVNKGLPVQGGQIRGTGPARELGTATKLPVFEGKNSNVASAEAFLESIGIGTKFNRQV